METRKAAINEGVKSIRNCYRESDVPALFSWANNNNVGRIKRFYTHTHLFGTEDGTEDDDGICDGVTTVFLDLDHKIRYEVMNMLWTKYGKPADLKNDATFTLIDVMEEMFGSACDDGYIASNMWGYTGTFMNFRKEDTEMFKKLRTIIRCQFGQDAYKMLIVTKNGYTAYGRAPTFMEFKSMNVTIT
jgi:putative N-acetylmannosamine-6-phosphate epimerase